MIMLLLVASLLMVTIAVVAKKVTNKLFRYSIITFFSALVIGIAWVMWIAAKSGEM